MIEKILSDLGDPRYLEDYNTFLEHSEKIDLDLFREVFNILDNAILCGVSIDGKTRVICLYLSLKKIFPLYTKSLDISPEMWNIYKQKLRAKKLFGLK